MYSKDVSSCSWRTRLIAYYQVSTCKIFNAEIIADENVSPLRASDGNSCTSITFQRLSFALSNIADFNQRMVKLNRGEAEKYKKKNVVSFYFSSLVREIFWSREEQNVLFLYTRDTKFEILLKQIKISFIYSPSWNFLTEEQNVSFLYTDYKRIENLKFPAIHLVRVSTT